MGRLGDNGPLLASLMDWALYNPKYSHNSYSPAAAEAEAREAGRGMWQGECELPWVWRKANR